MSHSQYDVPAQPSMLDVLDNEPILDYRMAASTSNNQKINIAEVNWKEVPDKYFIIIANFLAGRINDSKVIDQFSGPILKASLDSIYWVFLIQYAALSMLGIAMNVAIIAYIMYHRLFKDVTHAFIVNLAFCHFVQCAVVLPITLMVMLIQNWIFGQFLCFFLPMLQDIPLHVAMISHILIAWDRMRWLSDPLKGRLPAFVCCCATWLTGMVIALPYPIYMIYVEIGDYVPSLSGIGLCVVNLMDDMHEYMRGLFLIMYCGPTVLLAYLYIRTSQELRPPDGPFAVMMYEHRVGLRNRKRNSSASSVERSYSGAGGNSNHTATTGIGSGLTTITTHSNGHSLSATATTAAAATAGATTTAASTTTTKSSTRSYDLYSAELDVYREKRKQRNFGSMAATQVVCLCPLMVLRFARLSMEETYENQKNIDFTYLMFVWVAFLPTVIFPCIYASQILPRTEQERLRGYFRLSTKRLHKSHNSGGGGAHGESGNTPSSREDSIEKDDNTNTTQAASITANGEEYISGVCKGEPTATRHDLKSAKYQHYNNNGGSGVPYRQSKDGKYYKGSGGGVGGDSGKHVSKDVHAKKNDVKINIISDGKSKNGSTASRQLKNGMRGSSNSSAGSANMLGYANSQRRLTIESLDNNSCSNATSSTYCNGNSSLLEDDGGVSNFGDGEDSSIVSGMIVQGGSNGNSAYYDKKWSHGGQSLRHKDMSFTDSDTFSRINSSSTLDRDLEIIDLLERERSMNIQEMIEREKHGENIRVTGGERRRLPDIEKIYQRSPKSKLDPYTYEPSSVATASTISAKDSQTCSTSLLHGSDPLHSLNNEGYSIASTLNKEDTLTRDSLTTAIVDDDDEEVPQDFFDNYTPGSEANLPPNAANAASLVPVATTPPSYQYQYSRRLSRKSSHHSQGSSSHHRSSKRDSFNSLNGSDLIAGAFGELDPTQPLTKMSVIENRMRRSSGRSNASFSSSSARSSLKSRDYSQGSMHSVHPELDFRENIFAEL